MKVFKVGPVQIESKYFSMNWLAIKMYNVFLVIFLCGTHYAAHKTAFGSPPHPPTLPLGFFEKFKVVLLKDFSVFLFDYEILFF